MDYILPNDDTMRKMANEYAKIKRIGVPQRISSFSNDMPKTMPMKRLAKYLEETKKQDVLYDEENIEKMAYEYEKALSKGMKQKQNDTYYIDDGGGNSAKGYRYDFVKPEKTAKTQQNENFINSPNTNGNYYYGTNGQGNYGYGSSNGQDNYYYGSGSSGQDNYNNGSTGQGYGYNNSGQNKNDYDYNYAGGQQQSNNYYYGTSGGGVNGGSNGQVNYDFNGNRINGGYNYGGQGGGNYQYGGNQNSGGYQYGGNQGSGYQYGNYQGGSYQNGQNGRNSIPAEVIYQPSNQNNGDNFVIENGNMVQNGNGQNNFVFENGRMVPNNQNFGSNGFANDPNNRLRRGPNDFSIPQTDVIFEPSNGNGVNGNGSGNNNFDFANGNLVDGGNGANNQNGVVNNPYNSYKNDNVPNNPYRQPQNNVQADDKVPQVELVQPKDSPELIKLEPSLDENIRREQMFRQFAPQLFNSRLFNLALAVFFLSSF